MKPGTLACLLCLLVAGCASSKFKLVPDRQRLRSRVVAEATCTQAKSTHYTTFRDQYFRMLAMPPQTCWNAIFRVDHVIRGSFNGTNFVLVNARAETSYSRFYFEPGKTYTVGFDSISDGEVKHFRVIGREPPLPRTGLNVQ